MGGDGSPVTEEGGVRGREVGALGRGVQAVEDTPVRRVGRRGHLEHRETGPAGDDHVGERAADVDPDPYVGFHTGGTALGLINPGCPVAAN